MSIALGMASMGTQCTNKALGMASLGLFCGLSAHFLVVHDSWHPHVGLHTSVYAEGVFIPVPDMLRVHPELRWTTLLAEPRTLDIQREPRAVSPEERTYPILVCYEDRWITVAAEHRLTFVDAEVRVLRLPDESC